MKEQTPPREVALAEERMRSVVNHVVDGIISIDHRGTVTTFNPAAERIFGYSAVEVIGQNVKILMPEPYHGEHDGYIANYLRTGEAKIIGNGREVVGRRKDGGTFPMELAISVFELAGQKHFTGIVRDITDRKRSEEELRDAEERMRSVVNHVVDGIITIDEQGRIQSLNPAAERLFGYAGREVMGANVKRLMPEPYRGEHDGYIANYLRTGEAKIIGLGREVVGRRRDGTTFPMELAVSEFQIGGRRYFTGIVRDITERHRLEHELRRRLEELAEADRQKNEFLAMLAHELRNPLAPMRNALHLTKLSGSDDAIAERARDMMERQLEHLVHLVDDLLDISRIVRGKIGLRKEVVDVADAVSRAMETAQPVIDAHGHQLSLDLVDEPLLVDADPVRLAQVIANLLTNAAKYTEQAGRIWLTVERDGSDALVRVRDSGVGITPEMQSRVFDLFFQGHRWEERLSGGLGIGLTLVKRLVEMHQGEVSLFSEGLGRGSEFVVRLPVLAEERGDAARRPSLAEPQAQHRRRVLVVDDNVDAADSMAMILKLAGHDVQCVYHGLSVAEGARRFRPDVVLLDINLPGLNGYEVARLLREDPTLEHVTIIAVTGYGQEEDRRRTRDAGFDRHLTKPVDPTALQALVAAGAA